MRCIFLIAGILFFSSCKNTAGNTGVIHASNPGEVLVGRDGLDKNIKIQNYLSRNNNGLLEVQVDLKNTTSRDIAIEYSFEWLDADNFKIDTPIEHWVPVTLNGKHVRVVTAIAPRPGAKTFKIHVRYPHEVTR